MTSYWPLTRGPFGPHLEATVFPDWLPDPWPVPLDDWPVPLDDWPVPPDDWPVPPSATSGIVCNLESFDCLANIPSTDNCVVATERDEEEGKEGSLANGGLKMRKSDDIVVEKRVSLVGRELTVA